MSPNFSQKGFTLIELMIAITLGLIISAAALMIFLSSQRSLAMQNGLGEIGQNTIFGMANLTHHLRHINLDTGRDTIHPTQSGSGIIFVANQTSVNIADANVTQASITNNTLYNVNSDQLTMQYRARTGMTDCEGTAVPADTLVVQRYYIDQLPANQQADANNPRYGLFCDATWNGGGSAMRAGQAIVIPDAEALKVGIITRALHNRSRRNDDTTRYQTLAQYIAGATGDTVVGIEIGLIMRSSSSVYADRNINTNPTFNLAGTDLQLTTPPTTASYLRVAVNQVVAIRNSQGIE